MYHRVRGVYRGYGEAELVSNRASLLLYGGSAADRRAWAEEAQRNFEHEGPLRELSSPDGLAAVLEPGRGVVYLADACGLGFEVQAQLVRFLLEREERPKIIVGLPTSPTVALERGLLRDDLLYRLQMAQVDLSIPEIREAIRLRRQQEEERRAAASTLLPPAAEAKPEEPEAKQRPPVRISKTVQAPPRKGGKK